MGNSFPLRPTAPLDVQPEPGTGITVRRRGTTILIGNSTPGNPGGGSGGGGGGGGGGGTGDSSGTAGATIGAYRPLVSLAGVLRPASADASTHFGKLVGLSITAANTGQSVQYATGGTISNSAFSFVEGPIYLGLNGALTQTYPTKAAGFVFAQQIAVATAATTIVMGIQPPVLLA